MNKKCQVFTPANYVEELLDCVGYTENVYGKKILENSCGDGNILAAIVQRYIDDCKRQGLSRTKIKNGLEKDVYGVEIDPDQYRKCICNLNNVLIKNRIKPVKWNILNDDYLKNRDIIEYHFIVGNPPYITYKELEENEQKCLREKFESCKKGKFDYCYAFIEKSINSLTPNGKMAYLIPSLNYSWRYNLDMIFVILVIERISSDVSLTNSLKNGHKIPVRLSRNNCAAVKVHNSCYSSFIRRLRMFPSVS